MSNWIFFFLILAVISGLLAYSGVAADATTMAAVLFIIFFTLFVLALIVHIFKRKHY